MKFADRCNYELEVRSKDFQEFILWLLVVLKYGWHREIEEVQVTLEREFCGLDMEGLSLSSRASVEGHRNFFSLKKDWEKIEADLELCETAAPRKQLYSWIYLRL